MHFLFIPPPRVGPSRAVPHTMEKDGLPPSGRPFFSFVQKRWPTFLCCTKKLDPPTLYKKDGPPCFLQKWSRISKITTRPLLGLNLDPQWIGFMSIFTPQLAVLWSVALLNDIKKMQIYPDFFSKKGPQTRERRVRK